MAYPFCSRQPVLGKSRVNDPFGRPGSFFFRSRFRTLAYPQDRNPREGRVGNNAHEFPPSFPRPAHGLPSSLGPGLGPFHEPGISSVTVRYSHGRFMTCPPKSSHGPDDLILALHSARAQAGQDGVVPWRRTPGTCPARRWSLPHGVHLRDEWAVEGNFIAGARQSASPFVRSGGVFVTRPSGSAAQSTLHVGRRRNG